MCIRDSQRGELAPQEVRRIGFPWSPQMVERSRRSAGATICLLYTSDAADDLLCVDLGGRRIIKKKNLTQLL